MTRSVSTALVAALVTGTLSAPARAQSDPFIAQIMTTAANYCPNGWAETHGQLLPIAQNEALFALIGTKYGGNGQTTFALPTMKPIFTATGAPLLTCIALIGIFPSRN